MKKIKTGFVGYGYWGKNILRNLSTMDTVDLGIICDTNLDNLKKAKDALGCGPVYTTDYLSLISNPDVDAVVIATPPQTHYDMGYNAIKAGKHVFIEKPMTTSYKDAVDLSGRAIEDDVILMVGHTFLYHPVINDIKKLINSGEMGEIYYLDLIWTNLGKYQKDNVTWDLGPHGLSIVEYLMGEIIDIKLNSISAVRDGLLDVAYITAYLPNNKLANIHASWLNPNKRRELTIIGSRKMAVFNDLNPLEPLKIYNKGIEQTKSVSSWGASMLSYRHGNIVSPVTGTGEPLAIELQHFVDCILNNKIPRTDGIHGARIIKLIEKANKQYEK